MRRMRTAVVLIALTAVGCAPIAQRIVDERVGVPVERRPSANFDERRPTLVILHHTGDSSAQASLRVLTEPGRGVSSHYLVARDGTIFYLVEEKARAWHAGESHWGGQRDLNSTSIGIEIDNNGSEPFAEPQIEALLALLARIKARFNIPAANFIGHSDIAPARKVDPSRYFPWKRLAEQGYGLWCDPPYPAVPPGVDDALLLQAFGYNVWNFDAAVVAFKHHFVPDDPWAGMTEKDRSVLYCLVLEKRAVAVQGQ